MVKVVTRQCKCWPNSIGVDQDHVPENKVRLTYKPARVTNSRASKRDFGQWDILIIATDLKI